MPFLESYPLRHLGPRTDLSVAYLNATINNTTVTVNASETTAGFSISRTTNGVYAVTFKKCRFAALSFMWLPVAAADDRSVRLLAGVSPPAGTATIEISATLTGAAADPSAANNELELFFLLGF